MINLIGCNESHLPDDMTLEDLKKKHSSRPYNPILARSTDDVEIRFLENNEISENSVASLNCP